MPFSVDGSRLRGRNENPALLYAFEDFELDTGTRELRRAGALLSVEPKVFDLITHLIANREHVITKDALIAAIWDGRIVSDSALTTCINAARVALGDSGERQRLIKTLPRKGIRFVGVVNEDEDQDRVGGTEASAPRLPDKPSIAVMPFANLSGDPAQDYFTDGMVEDIITGLCRMGWLFVIARNSSFTYKGRAVDVKQVGRELGVRYVLEGSLRKAANRIRITTQLIDASTAAHISAERFDGTLDDVFDLQDQVTASVVGAIAPKLERAEIARAKRKPTDSLDAYDYYLRGLAAIYRWTRESHAEALGLFKKATEVDPDFAAAYALAARCYNWRATNGWMTDRAREVADAMQLARRAMDLGKDDAVALSMAGHTVARLAGDFEAGAGLIEQALALNPNLAAAWLSHGWVSVWMGRSDDAINRFEQGMRLSPIDPHMFNMLAGMASAHLIAGRYDQASVWAERGVRDQPLFGPVLRVAAASFALTGRLDDAKRMLRLVREADPVLRISNVQDRTPLRPDGLARLVEGLRKAGLPE
jgi:TolB-like protein/Tfp pilus assembly protein PilF